jgi:hypothetical protein
MNYRYYFHVVFRYLSRDSKVASFQNLVFLTGHGFTVSPGLGYTNNHFGKSYFLYRELVLSHSLF